VRIAIVRLSLAYKSGLALGLSEWNSPLYKRRRFAACRRLVRLLWTNQKLGIGSPRSAGFAERWIAPPPVCIAAVSIAKCRM
jgi:hypothetical protein